MNIDRYLNDELQIDNSIYDIAGESSADPTVYGYSGNESIRKYTFNELEVGMQLKKNNSILEEINNKNWAGVKVFYIAIAKLVYKIYNLETILRKLIIE